MMNRGVKPGAQAGMANTPPGMYPKPTDSQSQPNLAGGYQLAGFRSETVLGSGGGRNSGPYGVNEFPGATAGMPGNYYGVPGGNGQPPQNQFSSPGGTMIPGPSGGLFQNPMLQPGMSGFPGGPPNPMLNCLANLITNIIQTRKGYPNTGNSSCCAPANCPVPFIIRKVKPCQKKKRCQTQRACGQPSPCSFQPSSCSSGNNNNNNACCFDTKIRTLTRRSCGQPKSCCCKSQQPNALWSLGPQRQDYGTTNPFENNIAPILLVQGGRCQTIQIADIGCKCNANKSDRRRSSTSSTGRKRKRRKSKTSSKTSSVASSTSRRSGDSDESESDDD